MPRHYKRSGRRKRKGRGGVSRATKRYVKAQITEDLSSKFHDKVFSISPDDNGAMTDLSSIGVGTSDTTRIGDDIRPTHLSIHYALTGNSAATGYLVRVIVFQTRCRVTTTPDALFMFASGSMDAVTSPMAQFDPDLRGGFKVFYDKLHTMGKTDASVVSHHTVSVSKFAYKKIQYVASSAADKAHGIFMLCISDVAALQPSVRAFSRLSYTG